jgi:hypothetical protein
VSGRERRSCAELGSFAAVISASDGRQEPPLISTFDGLEPISMRTRPEKPQRNHIERKDVKCWSKHLNVTPDQLSTVMEQVGNSAAAVGKELQRLKTKT